MRGVPRRAENEPVGQNGIVMDLDTATRWIAEAGRITVLTGAGISTDSGIPDFRGPNGLWTKNPAAEKASNLQNYLSDPDLRKVAWQNRLTTPAWTATPNAGHLALSSSSGVMRCMPWSPRTSTGSINVPATIPTGSSRCTARCGGHGVGTATTGVPWPRRSTGFEPARRTRRVWCVAAS
jgi:hypothetical protein